MADNKFIASANLFGWGNSFNATGKFPIIAKRVWKTYADMYAFVSDTSDVCPAGVILTVVNDEDSSKNGAYFVEQCPTLDQPDLEVIVKKIGADEGLSSDLSSLTARVVNVEKIDDVTATSGLKVVENGSLAVNISSAEGNSLSVSEDGLFVSAPVYDLTAVDVPAEGWAAQYQFKVDGTVKTTINIPKDQFLQSASFHETAEEGVSVQAPYLKFVWNLDGVDEDTDVDVTYVPVGSLVDTYTAGSYIAINDHTVSVDYDALKAQINTDLVAAVATQSSTNATNIEGLTGRVDSLETDSVQSVSLNGVAGTKEGNAISLTIDLTPYATSQSVNEIKSGLETAIAGKADLTAFSDLSARVDEKATAQSVTDLAKVVEGKVDNTITINDQVLVSNIVLDAEDIKTAKAIGNNAADANLQTVLEDLNSRITSAVSGGLTSITAGSGISVGTVSNNSQQISVKVVEGSALTATTDGIDLVWTEL